LAKTKRWKQVSGNDRHLLANQFNRKVMMPNPIAYKKYDQTAYLFRVNRPDTGKRTTMRLGVVSKSVATGDMEDWFQWLQKPEPQGRSLSAATASKKLKDARQFFRYAVKKKLVEDNPVDDLRIPTQDNPQRLVEVPRAKVQQLIDSLDDAELRRIIALGRFAGLRVPSEVSCLQWSDVNFADGTLHVFASKTEHHARGGATNLSSVFRTGTVLRRGPSG
jgi:integrase